MGRPGPCKMNGSYVRAAYYRLFITRWNAPPPTDFELVFPRSHAGRNGLSIKKTYPAFFELLELYCYCVAGTVGLSAFTFSASRIPSQRSGSETRTAFQLTNILRDVPEDYAMGRVYLPQEDFRRFGCAQTELANPSASPPLSS